MRSFGAETDRHAPLVTIALFVPLEELSCPVPRPYFSSCPGVRSPAKMPFECSSAVSGSALAARAEVVSVFAFKDEELSFARALAERTNLWLFRVNQRAFAGDFVVVDLSSSAVEQRPAVALELKRGARLRDRQGIQMQRTDRVIAALAGAGLIAPTCVPLHLIGDAHQVLASIGAVLGRARRAPRTGARCQRGEVGSGSEAGLN